MCVYIWLIHVDVWQKPTQYYKASILQLKKNFKGRRGEEKERKKKRQTQTNTYNINISMHINAVLFGSTINA